MPIACGRHHIRLASKCNVRSPLPVLQHRSRRPRRSVLACRRLLTFHTPLSTIARVKNGESRRTRVSNKTFRFDFIHLLSRVNQLNSMAFVLFDKQFLRYTLNF